MEEFLIEKVRQHEVLYDFTSSNYRDLNMRLEAWEHIGSGLNVSATMAKEMWEKLRKSFLQATNRRRSRKSGQASKRLAPWRFEQQMSFLLPFLENRRTQDNLEYPQEEPQDDSRLDDPEEDGNTGNESIVDCAFQEDLDRASSVNKMKRKKETSPLHEMVEVMKENAVLRQFKLQELQRREMDETEMFFMSMCKMTKSLPAYEQTKIKLTLSNAVLHAQLSVQESLRQPLARPASAPLSESTSTYSPQDTRPAAGSSTLDLESIMNVLSENKDGENVPVYASGEILVMKADFGEESGNGKFDIRSVKCDPELDLEAPMKHEAVDPLMDNLVKSEVEVSVDNVKHEPDHNFQIAKEENAVDPLMFVSVKTESIAATNEKDSPTLCSNKSHCAPNDQERQTSGDPAVTKRLAYACQFCNKSFSKSYYLKVHLRVHTGERPYSCDTCKKQFSRVGVLKVHQRIHTSERPHCCDVCKKSFLHLSTLKVHQLMHTGERPYSCDVCRKTFLYLNVLKAHLRSHAGDRPYTCDICKKSFRQLSYLNAHQITHNR